MKRTLVILMVVAMVACFAMSANAGYIIKLQMSSGSPTGQVSNLSDSTPLPQPVGPNGDFLGLLWPGNVASGDATLLQLNMTSATLGTEWHGQIVKRGSPTGFDFRLFTASSAVAPTGTWYVFEGIGVGTEAEALASGTITATSWATSTFIVSGLVVGDSFTIADHCVPEPGSIIAVLTGLVGLVGLRRRSRK